MMYLSQRRTLNTQLDDSVVYSTVGHTDCDNSTIVPSLSLKRSMLSILVTVEMESRFSTKKG